MKVFVVTCTGSSTDPYAIVFRTLKDAEDNIKEWLLESKYTEQSDLLSFLSPMNVYEIINYFDEYDFDEHYDISEQEL